MKARLLALSAALSLAVAPAAAAPTARPGTARLTGRFTMTGKVTKAVLIRGEHVGQKVKRTWTFTPQCASGQCGSVQLVRQRQSGTDTLVLKRIKRGYYEGNGKFFARLRCSGRVYNRGMSVPFTIQVHLTAAAVQGGQAVATRIRASYTNRSRRNHTPCVAIPGHDAARYTGKLVSAGPLPAAEAASLAISRSPAGS